MLKRLIGTIISLAIAASAMQVQVSAEESYYWLEAEDGVISGFDIQENSNASAGKLTTIYNINAPANGAYTISLEFDNAAAGNYDIWFLAGEGNSNSMSRYKWSLNGENKGNYINTGEANPVVYRQTLAFVPQNLQWSRVGREVSLPSGENTIEITVDSKAISGTRSYINLFDCAVIVPASWRWQPDADVIKPEPLPTRYAWIELETPSSKTRFGSAGSSSASGGSMLYVYGLRDVDDDNDVEKLEYDFSVERDGSYDIWFLGCATDYSAAHVSSLYWDVDAEAPVTSETRNENPQGNSPTILYSAGATAEIPLYWQKMGTRDLTVGDHTLNLTYALRTLPGSPRMFMTWADCVMVVPAEWKWTPPVAGDKDILPDFTAGWLAGKYIEEKYFTGDYSALTDNITLPESLKNPGDCKISFESDNKAVMSDAGIVTRPLFTQTDADFNFNITATHGDRTNKYPIPVTVKKLDKYDISPIEVTDEAGNTVTTLVSGEMIKASVNMKVNVEDESPIHGQGTLLMLLYDNAGILVMASMAEEQIDNDIINLSAQMTLPDDVSGAKLKVYLLNGLSLANQLIQSVEL